MNRRPLSGSRLHRPLTHGDRPRSFPDVSGDEDEPDAPSQERVTVKFARPESDRVKQAREKSYHYLKKRQDELPWLPTSVHKRNSASSEVSADLAMRYGFHRKIHYFHKKYVFCWVVVFSALFPA